LLRLPILNTLSRNEDRYIIIACISGLVIQFLCYVFCMLFLPPDFSGEYAVFAMESNFIIIFGMSLNMASVTILGIKAGDERQLLASGGFTMFAIALGISISSLYEVVTIVDQESFDKSYFINSSSTFLYVPAVLLISTYKSFSKWIHYLGIVTVVPALTGVVLFTFKLASSVVIDIVVTIGYLLLSFTQLMWATNIYIVYRKTVALTDIDTKNS
jgi:hypothetical protein